MTTTAHQQHQGATDVLLPPPPSWPSAGPPTAAPLRDDAAGGAITPGAAVAVAGAVVIFVAISVALLPLRYCFDAWDRGTRGRRRRRRRRGDGTAGSNGGAARTRGVDPELLRSLPVTVYRAAAPGSKDDVAVVECSVCLAELQDGEAARFLPRCGHGFHAECVDTWLASHTTCPLCRLTVGVAKPLRPLPREPVNSPRSVRLGVSGQSAVTAANVATDGDDMTASTGAAAAAAVVIEIPELLTPVPTLTPRDAAKSSPVSARQRSFRRLWSFGRQGSSPSSTGCTCGGAREVTDVEQGVGVTIGVAVAEAQLPSEATASARGASAV